MKEKLRLFYLSPTGHNYANNGCKYMIILFQMWSYFIQLDDTSAFIFKVQISFPFSLVDEDEALWTI